MAYSARAVRPSQGLNVALMTSWGAGLSWGPARPVGVLGYGGPNGLWGLWGLGGLGGPKAVCEGLKGPPCPPTVPPAKFLSLPQLLFLGPRRPAGTSGLSAFWATGHTCQGPGCLGPGLLPSPHWRHLQGWPCSVNGESSRLQGVFGPVSSDVTVAVTAPWWPLMEHRTVMENRAVSAL